MHYLKVTNLTKSYTDKKLVDHVDFAITKNQKIALVAKNGVGKTTLIKLLMKEIDVTDGVIDRREDIKIWYLCQEYHFEKHITVKEFLFDFDTNIYWEEEVELNVSIEKLRIKPYLDQTMDTLSGGEAKRVMLAKVLAGNPSMLVLDEPTNHLDLDMIEWLERYLKKHHITLLMVTHDRYFLERVCTDIRELDRGKIHYYPGNYSYFLEKKAIREENEKIEMHKFHQLFKKELAWIRRAPQWRQTKASFREQRFDQIAEKFGTKKDLLRTEHAKLDLEVEERRLWGKILHIKHMQKAFGPKKIVNDFSHECRHGERIGIIGKNGVGKSTFINMIMGQESLDKWLIQTGESVVFGYYEQKHIDFPSDKRLIDIVPDPKLLEKFLFFPKQQHQFAHSLSWGEKRRLYLLTILQKNPNFLILDEPTNDLDLITLGILEEFLLAYKWCLIVVSHDRFFMDKIVDHLFVFEGEGVINDFRWTYSEYKSAQDQKLKKEKTETKIEKQEYKTQITEKPKKLSYMEQRELDQLAKDIQTMEKRKEEIQIFFNDPNCPFDDIKKFGIELNELLKQLELKENRRFELIERAW